MSKQSAHNNNNNEQKITMCYLLDVSNCQKVDWTYQKIVIRNNHDRWMQRSEKEQKIEKETLQNLKCPDQQILIPIWSLVSVSRCMQFALFNWSISQSIKLWHVQKRRTCNAETKTVSIGVPKSKRLPLYEPVVHYFCVSCICGSHFWFSFSRWIEIGHRCICACVRLQRECIIWG